MSIKIIPVSPPIQQIHTSPDVKPQVKPNTKPPELATGT